ncbi:MAG: helix-turn-helix domain-containing protein [Hungatella hathewayi]|nr:helix-turn-helix domain-containing protein [Hungatella hathewayi]
MSTAFESIMAGLTEAVVDAESKDKKLKKRIVTVIPVKEYRAEDVKRIRKAIGMSQKMFAGYMGVSEKTVEAWEAGTNHPSGTASRLLNMMEMDEHLTQDFPFVQTSTE